MGLTRRVPLRLGRVDAMADAGVTGVTENLRDAWLVKPPSPFVQFLPAHPCLFEVCAALAWVLNNRVVGCTERHAHV